MLDEIFELFERDKKKRYGRPTGKRSLLDRVSGVVGDGDDRPRYADDRPDRRRDDDDQPTYDDRYRDSDNWKPSKKRRLADLLDFG